MSATFVVRRRTQGDRLRALRKEWEQRVGGRYIAMFLFPNLSLVRKAVEKLFDAALKYIVCNPTAHVATVFSLDMATCQLEVHRGRARRGCGGSGWLIKMGNTTILLTRFCFPLALKDIETQQKVQ